MTSDVKPQSSQTELRRVLETHRKNLLYVALFSFFINLLMLVPPLYMLQIYDRVLTSRSTETLLVLTLVVLWLFMTMGMLEFVRSRILVRLSARLDDQLNSRLYQSVSKLALQEPEKATHHPLMDLSSLRQFLSSNAPFVVFDAPWVTVYLGILFLFHTSFGWFAVFATAVLVTLTLINEFSTRGLQRQASDESMKATNAASAQLRNAEVLHAMGMQNALRERWLRNHLQGLKAQCEASDRNGLWTSVSKTLRLLFQSLILALGAYLAILNEITAGMVIAGSILMGRALAPVDQLIGSWKQFTGTRAAYHRLNAVLSGVPATAQRMSLPVPKGALQIENAVLIPPGGQTPVLKGVSLALRAGETLALVGPSAAGKSSLVRAILGVWPLAAGSVRLDGTELQHWNRDELGPRIGYLPQDIELFDGTVAENIARFNEIDDFLVMKAAQRAGVDNMIRALPDGYETRIGVGGVALSGGQRQLLGLARALYGRPKLVVLDEPNSNLDEEGELALLRACLYVKKRNATLILVTHRRNILSVVDKVLVLEDGRLRLFGPRDAVLERLMPGADNPKVAKRHIGFPDGEGRRATAGA